MKIDPKIQLPGDIQSEPTKNSRKPGSTSSGSPSTVGVSPATGQDTVSISSTAADIQMLKVGLANIPEVRTDRVSALQGRVNSGQYNPDSQNVADAMIADHLNRGVAA
jgi:negative regulator of flagellin synthesis FlgM